MANVKKKTTAKKKDAPKKLIKKLKEKVPYLVSKNHSIKPLRMQRDKVAGSEERYPLGRYPFPVAIIHGSRTKNAYARSAQAIGGVILNHPDFIKNASDKLKTKQLLEEAGVPTTPYMAATAVLNNGKRLATRMTLSYPVVAKKRSGMGGEGMKLLRNLQDLRMWKKNVKTADLDKWFFEEAFNFGENGDWSTQDHNKWTREYRIGVSPLLNGRRLNYTYDLFNEEGEVTGTETEERQNGTVVALRKMMRQDASENGAFGRNLALGNSYFKRDFTRDYNYEKRNVAMNWEEGVQLCQTACEALGLDYGAVDILWSSKTGEWCVVEVNTAPSMGTPEEGHAYTLEQWRQGFRNMVEARCEQLGL